MPRYDYHCPSCDDVFEDDASMSSFKDYHPSCPSCGTSSSYVYIPSVPQVAFKDGPSGSWPSKGVRFKQYRAEQSAAAERRQNERFGPPKSAIPNYKGQEAPSWREAQAQALVDKGPEVAATFNHKVREEESKKVVA